MSETQLPEDEILATIAPSAPRRLIGLCVLALLGGLLIYLGLANPPAELHWQVFLIGLGGLTLYLAEALRRATSQSIELTATELRESGGRLLAPVDRIVAVDRGTFAIKPSNGFLLRLSDASANGSAWAPGLWWRLGRRVGIGGITSASQAKAMAEILSAIIAHRAASQATDD